MVSILFSIIIFGLIVLFLTSQMEKSYFQGYFKFRLLITPSIVPVIYYVGAVLLIIIGCFAPATQPFRDIFGSIGAFIFGFFIIILIGNMLWRFICESFLISFKNNEILKNYNLDKKNKIDK